MFSTPLSPQSGNKKHMPLGVLDVTRCTDAEALLRSPRPAHLRCQADDPFKSGDAKRY
jgi:hypothetical protein